MVKVNKDGKVWSLIYRFWLTNGESEGLSRGAHIMTQHPWSCNPYWLCLHRHLADKESQHSNMLLRVGTAEHGRGHTYVQASWNVMAHAQKPDFVFRRNGRIHLYRRGHQFSRLLAAEVCASAVVMLDTQCSEVECKTTGYPLHSPVSPSLPLACVTVCHHVSTGVYSKRMSPRGKRAKSETTISTTWYMYNRIQNNNPPASFFLFLPPFKTTQSHQHASIIYKQNTHLAKWFCTVNRLQNYKFLCPS